MITSKSLYFQNKFMITKFVGETMNVAVLNSGCTQKVCGFSWLKSYLELLTDDHKSKVIQNESHTGFKFGDGNRLSH